jgi:outer membrane protein assembly factor BamB
MERKTLGILLILGAIIALIILQSPGTTPELWTRPVNGEIKSPPVFDTQAAYFFIDDQHLARLDKNGTITHRVPLKSPYQFPLVQTSRHLLVVDRQGHTHCFAKSNLTPAWSKQDPIRARLSPLALPGDLFLIQKDPGFFLAVEAEKGDVQWEARFSGEVVNVVVDRVLSCVHGYSDLKSAEWKISGINIADGQLLWTFPQLVAEGNPHPIMDMLAFCDAQGRPQIVDQQTGTEQFQHEKSGFRIFAAQKEFLFNLAAGGSILECINLATGKSWSANLPSPLVNAIVQDDMIFVIDGKGIRSVKADTGEIKWERELGKTFHAFSLSTGPVVTWKAAFTDHETFLTCFNPRDGTTIWSCMDRGIFWHPWPLERGDATFCRTGVIRLMPLPPGIPPRTLAAPESVLTPTPAPTRGASEPAVAPTAPAPVNPGPGKPAFPKIGFPDPASFAPAPFSPGSP